MEKISGEEFRLKYALSFPNQDSDYALKLYMSEYDPRLRVVKAKNKAKRKKSCSSNNSAIQEDDPSSDDDKEPKAKEPKVERTIIHVIPRMSEYASPNCIEELTACHITDPLSQEQIDQMVELNNGSIKHVWFWDIESIPMEMIDLEDCFADSVIIGAYGQSCKLKLTCSLERLVKKGQFRLVSSGSGKERADGMLDILVMDLHHRIQDKNIKFVILSNDSGFDSLACTVCCQKREMIRVSVRGDQEPRKIYRHACKSFE
jgi:hypothetical protein